MAISIALFGFAASGTFLCILDKRKKHWERQLAKKKSLLHFIHLYTLFTIAAFVALNNMPIDFFRLPLDTVQALYLLAAFIFLALPFFFTGLIVTIAYSGLPEKSGLVYFATMAGSACGALLPIPLLPVLGEGKLIIISALLPFALMSLKWPGGKLNFSKTKKAESSAPEIKPRVLILGRLIIIIISIFLMSPAGDYFIRIKPSQYKALSQTLRFPGAQVTKSVNDLRGRIDHVKSKYIRFAPGLSLKFTEKLPMQKAGFKDGDNPFILYDIQTQKDALFAKFTLPYSGYTLSNNAENILVIENGGGLAIPCAIASGAKEITVIEQNPEMAKTVQQHYNLFVINQNPRSFLARSNKRFDIIHVENWGSSIPDMAALTQEHLLTIDAVIQYLTHLSDHGIIIISRKLLLPPADSIRLWSVAYKSLKSLGINSPEQHIIILRNWDTFTLIISLNPVEKKQIDVIKKFTKNLNFDLVYFPGISTDMTNIFNIFDKPYHFLEISRLEKAYQSGKEKNFFRSYYLDVSPQTDNRPFPSRFLKWSGFSKFFKSKGSRLYSILMSGEIIVSVVFVEALVISIFLLVIPLVAFTQKKKKPLKSNIFFFLSVGAGFIFLELFFIKKYILLFGNPTVSFAIVVSEILVFSGIGGYCSQRISPNHFKSILIVLIFVLIVILVSFDSIIYYILVFSSFPRFLLASILLFPAGFLAGLPFSLGMRYLLKSPVERAYAWSAN
ncbi:MAG: hypothetical protein HKO79_03065, partial [Desulfobacterales bacterium]|nr:hypothetical protein [Desulfobacterales bacterium]